MKRGMGANAAIPRAARPLRKLGLVAGLVVVTAGLAAYGGTSRAHAAKQAANPLGLVTPGVLTVANFGTEYPDVIVNGNKISGIDGDLLNAFATQNNLKIKLFSTSFPSTILAVQQHRADVAVNFYWNPDRAKQVRYAVPFYQDASVVITNKSKVNYTGPSSLKGKKIGVIVGTIYTPIVQGAFPSSDITTYPGIPEAGNALINGQVDALIESISTYNAPPLRGSKALAEFPIKVGQFGFTKANVSFTTSNIAGCNNAALVKALDAHLKSLEQSGEWAKMVDKYAQYGASHALVPPFKVIPGGCNG